MTTADSCTSGGNEIQEEKKTMDGGEEADMTCDYLVVGGGATGMAFVDSLLEHSTQDSSPSVVMVDKHASPGGQWNDSYSFVRLHQPSKGYGVETEKLEPSDDDDDDASTGAAAASELHRATRSEILAYYDRVRRNLETNYDYRFVGEAWFDFAQLNDNGAPEATCSADEQTRTNNNDTGGTLYRVNVANASRTVLVTKRVVDARYLEPDLPIFVEPKFAYNKEAVKCVPVNSLSDTASDQAPPMTKHYVVIGGGKTGMDAITYLQTHMNVDPDNIMWIVPNDVWITAREDIGSCMEFLHTCTEIAKRQNADFANDVSLEQLVKSPFFFQLGFLEWERTGKVYRLDGDSLPEKFKDATLSEEEMAVVKRVTRVIRRQGRVEAIRDNGDLQFVDGTIVPLPWALNGDGADETTFVHASAGAFNYSKHPDVAPPVFGKQAITIQDVYGTPGFCFVGSMLGKLESLGDKLSDADKNAMCLAPEPDPTQATQPLGPSGGDVGVISTNHGYVQRVSNLKKWLDVPELKKWLVGHRLFNLGHLNEQQIVGMVEQIMEVLVECGIICL